MDNPNFRFVKADICDREAVDKLFEEEHPDIVVNFAAESHVDRSIEDPGIFLQTNIIGTSVLMDACRKYGIQRYHQVSTDEVYGDLPLDRPDLFFTEETPIHTSSPYSSSKAAADLLVLAYHRTYGLPVTISRCSNNYGPYHFPEKLIPLMIANALADKPLPVYGEGLNVRDWLYVEDHCKAIDLINIIGTSVLMDACRKYGIQRYHQVSTDEVYGDLPLDRPDLFFTEETPIHTSSPYSSSKAAADLLVLAYNRTYGLPVTISRCSNNYGPYHFPEKLIPLMIANALADKPLPVYGEGLNVRDWLYVEDHCKAIDLIIHKGRVGEVYNVGGHNEKQNIEIVKIICKELGKPESLITHVGDRKGHDMRYAIDPTKIHNDVRAMICVMLLIRPRSTMSWAGCRRPSLRTALKRPSSGISIIVSGGRPSSAVSIRTTTRKCTATAKSQRRKEHEVFCNRRWRSVGP